MSTTPTTRKSFIRTWPGRILVFGVAPLALLLVIGVLLIPTIAGSMAPGIIQNAAGKAIAGSVKVKNVSVSWGGPIEIGSVELFDDKGEKVGQFRASSSLGILSLLGSLKDLGTVTLSGRVDIVARPAGATRELVTNLQRAVASKSPSPAPASSEPTKLPPGYTAVLDLAGITATYKELDAAGKPVSEAAMNDAKGKIRFATSGPKAATAGIELDAGFAEGPGAATSGRGTGTLKVRSTVENLTDGSGVLTIGKASTDTTIEALGVPMRLVDALAQQNGVLLEAVGDKADLTARVSGSSSDATVQLALNSPGAHASAELKAAGGRLIAQKPVTLSLASTAFVKRVPAVRDALRDSGADLQQMSALELSITSLNIPTASGADYRGSAADITVKLGEIRGQLTAKPAPAAVGGDTPAATAPAAAPRPFVIAPIETHLAVGDLASGATLTASTSATLDGKSAGALSISMQATHLLDSAGKLAGGVPNHMSGNASVKGLSTELLRPILAGANVPIDPATDIGPAADVELKAVSQAAGATDVDLTITSANIAARAPLTISPTSLTSRGEITASINTAAPIARKFLKQQPDGSGTIIDGVGRVNLSVSELSAPIVQDKPDVNALIAKVRFALADATVTLRRPNTGDVTVRAAQLAASADWAGKDKPIKLAATADLEDRTDGGTRPFRATADVQVTQAGSALPSLGANRAQGSVQIKGVPRQLIEAFAPAGQARDLATEIAASGIDAALTFGPADPAGQTAQLSVTSGQVLQLASTVRLNADSIAISDTHAMTSVGAVLLNRLLAMPATAADGSPAPQVTDAVRLEANLTPITVPLKKQGAVTTLEPDWSRAAGDAQATVTLSDLSISGVKVGQQTATAQLKGTQMTAKVPLAALAPNAPITSRATATLGAELLSGSHTVAKLTGGGQASLDGSFVDASIGLADTKTTELDAILGRDGLISGAMGDPATFTIKAARAAADSPLTVLADVASPRLAVTALSVTMDQKARTLRVSSDKPIVWTVDGAWASKNFLAPKPVAGAPTPASTLVLENSPQVSLTLRQAIVALPHAAEAADGSDAVGPFKPGVFAVDAGLAVPSATLVSQTAAATPGAAPTRSVSKLNGIRASIKTDAAGAVALDAAVNSVDGFKSQSAAQAAELVTMTGRLVNLADSRGIATPDKAVATLDVTSGAMPTALVEVLSNQHGQLVSVLGEQLDVAFKAHGFSMGPASSPGSPPAQSAQPGSLSALLKSDRTFVEVAGPVRDGVLDTTAEGGKQLKVEVKQFTFQGGSKAMSAFPIFASVSRPASVGPQARPASITSTGLKAPLGGDMSKFNGDITVDLGQIEYLLGGRFADMIRKDATTFGGAGQLPTMKPFTVKIASGVATYRQIEIPVISGATTGAISVLRAEGSTNLVNQTIDMLVDIPGNIGTDFLFSEAAGAVRVASSVAGGMFDGLLAHLNKGVGKPLNEVMGALVIPVRISGPLASPKVGVDGAMLAPRVLQAVPNILGTLGLKTIPGIPQDIGNAIGDLLGGGKKDAPANMAPAPSPAPSATPPPAAPALPGTRTPDPKATPPVTPPPAKPAAPAATPSPKPADPKATPPKPVDPKATPPKPADPKATPPKPVDPKATPPKPADPKAPAPKPTDPNAPAPKPGDPKPGDPKPTDPNPAGPP